MTKKNIFIVDDHPVFREGLKLALSNDPQFQLVGESPNGKDALEKITQILPDIAFIDIEMPGYNGIQLVHELKKRKLPVHIIILSQFSDDLQIKEFIDLGIHSYVIKNEPTEEIIRALHSVSNDQNYFSPMISQKLFNLLQKTQQELKEERKHKISSDISPREREIALFVSTGKTNKEIAALLNCSEHTVKSHKSNLMRKIGAKTSAQISAWIVQNSNFYSQSV
jgi:DNA-binding NarL/FixJ family response regulator